MDPILINGQDVPVLNSESENELPLVSHKGHHGYVASGEECVDELSFDGVTFWCPIEFLRISEGDENIRKTPFTEDETDRYTETIKKTGDIGTLIVCADLTDKTKLRILDGNNRFPIFVDVCSPSHVFVKYVEVSSEYEARQIQDTANEHSETTHRTEAFAALANKRDIDAMPKGDRQAQFDYQYAKMRCKSKARGKTEFDKLWKRARYAIPELWTAFEKGQITIESLDWIATLVDIDTDEILSYLQQQVLDTAIKEKYKTSQVENEVKTVRENWERALQSSQQAAEPVVDDDADEVELVSAKGATRPAPATAPKASSPPTPQPPVEKVTKLDVEIAKQTAKATKGQGGKKAKSSSGGGKAAKNTASTKVTTNAPASIPAAIAANPNVHVIAISESKPKIKDVDPYALLYAFELELVDGDILNSTGEIATPSFAAKVKKADPKYIQDLLSQVAVMRGFLKTIESTAQAA